VVDGSPVPWSSDEVPSNLRTVVNHLVKTGAYKPFNGATVGHFAVKVNETTFLTSIRKSNFNDIEKNGLVKVTTDGPDSVITYGSRPSVGGQSQRYIFGQNPGYDCIVHAHIPLKENPRDAISVVSQREYECGSHECGLNTANGLKDHDGLKVVFLDNHGPNIVFNKDVNPEKVIDFIEANFAISDKTGGLVKDV
jgi:ribulose-5-phosphate 4-epimerase/fuculose-1-phosphate aldolase